MQGTLRVTQTHIESDGDFLVVAGADTVGENVDSVTVFEQVQSTLKYTDVRFDSLRAFSDTLDCSQRENGRTKGLAKITTD